MPPARGGLCFRPVTSYTRHVDPLVAALQGALVLFDVPPARPVDPGPSPDCPKDMRLVSGTHYDLMQHLCLEGDEVSQTWAGKTKRVTHCHAYLEDVSAEEGDRLDVRTCMDQYEAPNQKGARPLTMQSFKMAEKWCAKRGKRVCSEQEWELACEGGDRRPWSYGWRMDKNVCNSNKAWKPFDLNKLAAGGEGAKEESARLWQGANSGQFAACASPFGVFDLNGNLEEWVRSRKWRAHDGALMGGFWAKAWTGCRGTNDAHPSSFVFYETGFRCCKEPGPQPADPKADEKGAAPPQKKAAPAKPDAPKKGKGKKRAP